MTDKPEKVPEHFRTLGPSECCLNCRYEDSFDGMRIECTLHSFVHEASGYMHICDNFVRIE